MSQFSILRRTYSSFLFQNFPDYNSFDTNHNIKKSFNTIHGTKVIPLSFLLCFFEPSSSVKFKENDVSILDDVIPSLLPVFPGRFTRRLRSFLLKIIEFHDFSHDKSFFEIRVNSPCRPRCFRSFLKKERKKKPRMN